MTIQHYNYKLNSSGATGLFLAYLDRNAIDLSIDHRGHLFEIPGADRTYVRIKTLGEDGSESSVSIQTTADGGLLRANRDLANLLTDLKAKVIISL